MVTSTSDFAASEPAQDESVQGTLASTSTQAPRTAPASHAPHDSPSTARKARRRPAPLCQATGRRKEAVARVRIRTGQGTVTVNGKPIEVYFPSLTHRTQATEPLRLVTAAEGYDVDATIDGGGLSGQAGALRLGIARGLVEVDPEVRSILKKAGFLTRDARVKESKKYGLKKARKAPQYSKR
jgi:small subunit ribosomal protein S9